MPAKTVLDNGVRVVTEHIPWATSVSIGFWIGSGSRDEGPAEAGYAHLVEHMMFKGTSTRSARDIAEAMDRTGGHLNAFTTKETTCYHCRVLHHHMPLALHLLADMLLYSTFHPTELAREKTVILEEIKQVEDDPEDLVHDLFDGRVFRAHPLAASVLGTRDSVAGATREDVLRFVGAQYRPDNIVVAVAGNVRHEDVVNVTASVLDDWAGSGRAPQPPALLRTAPTGYEADRTVIDKDGEQIHLCVGVPGRSRYDADRYALDLLDTVVGGGMSSRLFQQLREKKGLVYSTYSFSADYSDAGLFGCYAASGPERADEVLQLMLAELEAIRGGDVKEAEIERAKEQLKGALLLGWENTGTRMAMLADATLAGEPYASADELSARYDAVTVDDVRRIAGELLKPEAVSIVALGPASKGRRKQNFLEAIG